MEYDGARMCLALVPVLNTKDHEIFREVGWIGDGSDAVVTGCVCS